MPIITERKLDIEQLVILGSRQVKPWPLSGSMKDQLVCRPWALPKNAIPSISTAV